MSYLERLADAKNNSRDSGEFTFAIQQIDAEAAAVQPRTAACLIGEIASQGVNSGTPTVCPVEGCNTTLDQRENIQNRNTCLNSEQRAQNDNPYSNPKYP